MRLNLRNLSSLIASVLIFVNILEASKSNGNKKKNKEKRERNGAVPYDPTEQFVNEEYYISKNSKTEQLGKYKVIGMTKRATPRKLKKPSRKQNSIMNLNDFILNEEDDEGETDEEPKIKERPASTHFNGDIESESEVSSVADEYPRCHPSVTETNPRFSDFVSGRRTRIMLHLPMKMGDFDIPPHSDDTDVLAKQVRKAMIYTTHDQEYDGFMTVSKKESRDIHLWRNESIHPQRTYDHNNEVNPLVPYYDEDVDTAQNEFETHFGRYTGRDNKKKLFPNRNSFSSVNEGCTIC